MALTPPAPAFKDSTIHVVRNLRGGASKGWYGSFDMGETARLFGDMGIAAGGLIKQYIQPDRYERNSWDPSTTTAINVQILTIPLFERVTNTAAPPCPIRAETYLAHGFSFFDIPEATSSISGNFNEVQSLAALKSLRDLFLAHDGDVEHDPVGPKMGFRTLSDIKDRIRTDFPAPPPPPPRQRARPNRRKNIEAQAAAAEPAGSSSGNISSKYWRCVCGYYMEHEWWTCAKCGKMKTSS
jgi:hypothetical protein